MTNLTLTNEMLNIKPNENFEPTVSGRELHKFLAIGTRYTQWFDEMLKYDFVENVDFILVSEKRATNNPKNPYTEIINHFISLDMAKELAMIQRTPKGKEARQYFIQVEKEYNSPEKIMARALIIAKKEVSTLQLSNEHLQLENKIKDQVIAELKPKAGYTDRVLQSKGLTPVSIIAKDYGMSANKFNRLLNELGVQYRQCETWLLYAKYQDKGYTSSKTFDYEDSEGLTQTRLKTQWTQKGRLFLYNILKEKGIFPMIELRG